VRVTILGSGSEGNALLLETETTAVVVDAGLSYRKVAKRLAALGRSAPHVSAVLVTHTHTDHASHSSVYARRWACPLHASSSTMRSLRIHASVDARTFDVGRRFQIGNLTIRSRSIPHDAPQVALVFETQSTSVGLVTDLGHVPKGLPRFFSGCDTVLLESNHDEEMLRIGPYPQSLKRRVSGTLGHLSNAQAGDLLASLSTAPKRVVLMHLSKTNNTVGLARSSAEAALGHGGTDLFVAPRNQAIVLPSTKGEQLSLGW